jgi:hypothetical protein
MPGEAHETVTSGNGGGNQEAKYYHRDLRCRSEKAASYTADPDKATSIFLEPACPTLMCCTVCFTRPSVTNDIQYRILIEEWSRLMVITGIQHGKPSLQSGSKNCHMNWISCFFQ